MQEKYSLGYPVAQFVQTYRKILISRLCSRGLPFGFESFKILNEMAMMCEPTQQSIAEVWSKDKSIVQRQVNALIELGLVERSVSKCDKRKKILILTEAGTAEFAKAKAISYEITSELLHDTTAEDQAIFRQVLGRMTGRAVEILKKESRCMKPDESCEI